MAYLVDTDKIVSEIIISGLSVKPAEFILYIQQNIPDRFGVDDNPT